ncbi:UNVERIFIED_CONTAM: hypothetical protein HHA_307620 [Hammondia hammondi]|eukprot:XP_008888860.1 hypothetical protein HHA_307620 [Hammondia hammondi]
MAAVVAGQRVEDKRVDDHGDGYCEIGKQSEYSLRTSLSVRADENTDEFGNERKQAQCSDEDGDGDGEEAGCPHRNSPVDLCHYLCAMQKSSPTPNMFCLFPTFLNFTGFVLMKEAYTVRNSNVNKVLPLLRSEQQP